MSPIQTSVPEVTGSVHQFKHRPETHIIPVSNICPEIRGSSFTSTNLFGINSFQSDRSPGYPYIYSVLLPILFRQRMEPKRSSSKKRPEQTA